MPELPGLREQAQSILQRAESTPAGEWQITEDEHAAMVSFADLFALTLPVSSFRSTKDATSFLRQALAAMDRPAPSSPA